MNIKNSGLALFLALTLALPTLSAAGEVEAMPLPPGYGLPSYGLQPAHSYGQAQFVKLPCAGELTATERVMIAGLAQAGGRAAHISYWRAVFHNLDAVYRSTGEIPDQLTPEVVAQALGIEVAAVPWRAEMRNPLSGDYPYLKRGSYAPGEFSVKPLTETEKQHFATRIPEYRARWYMGHMHLGGQDEVTRVEKNPPVFFVQMYGEHERVIEQGLRFRSRFSPSMAGNS